MLTNRALGMSRSPEYRAYMDAKSRCNNPRSQRYYTHGGRGIKFLFEDFAQFFAEIGTRPDGMTLDRINNDGHYEPGNVRWATPSQQCFNRRQYNRKFRVRNEVAKTFIVVTPENKFLKVHNMAEFCRQHGLTKSCLHRTLRDKYDHKGYRAFEYKG